MANGAAGRPRSVTDDDLRQRIEVSESSQLENPYVNGIVVQIRNLYEGEVVESADAAMFVRMATPSRYRHRLMSDPSTSPTSFAAAYLAETHAILERLDPAAIESVATGLARSRDQGGRLFILGVGGSAGHASHAVNDFRKLCGFEAYAPTDNVSELTARTNDEGWETVFAAWLETSRLGPNDSLLIFSVGGGDAVAGISVGLVRAIERAEQIGASIYGIVGREGGFTAQRATACVVIPPLYGDHITPHTEGLCAVVWHLLVSHPALHRNATKWESVQENGDA